MVSRDPFAGIHAGVATTGRAPMSEHVVKAIREAILSGALAPGTSLREVALADRFGVSRHTVREAIRALVTEGLVQHLMHRGAVVAQPTAGDVIDVYRARVAVEVAAVDRLGEADQGALDALSGALAALESAVREGESRAITEADLAFHRRLVGLSGSPRLDAFYAHLQGELRLLLLLADRDAPDERKVAEHRRILDLARARDVSGLREALSSHVQNAQAVLLRVLEARSRGCPPADPAVPSS